MRLSLVTLTTSLAVAVFASPIVNRDQNADDAGISVGADVGVSGKKRDQDAEDGDISVGADRGVSGKKRNAAPVDPLDIAARVNPDGTITIGKRIPAPDDDGDIGVGASATVGVN